MANAIGPATWARCATYLQNAKAKVYEVSQIRSNTMPLSPFTGLYVARPKPTTALPGTAHAFNSETLNEGAEPGQQGTQIDALGHFAYFKQPSDGKGAPPLDGAIYFGGYTQKEVKPTPDSPLLKLGMEKAPPIVTSAVLLDAKALVDKVYYSKAPGLSYDAAQYLGKRRIVAIGLDTPFIDTVAEGMLQGKGGPAPGTPPGMPFAIHHHMITQMGIHHRENSKLDALAKDKAWTSCTMILPLLEKGAAGSAIRPVAIGVPGK